VVDAPAEIDGIISKRRRLIGKRWVAAGGFILEERYRPVTERFFSGVPQAPPWRLSPGAVFHSNEDALTKVVLNAPALEKRLLARHNAEAFVFTA
jgi:hypothetical protein